MGREKNCAAKRESRSILKGREESSWGKGQRPNPFTGTGSHHCRLILKSCITLPSVSFQSVWSVYMRDHVGRYPITVAYQPGWVVLPWAPGKEGQVEPEMHSCRSNNCRKSKQFLEKLLECPAYRAKDSQENSDLGKLQAFSFSSYLIIIEMREE